VGKCGRCLGLTTLPPSSADCLEIWEPQPPGTLRVFQVCNGLALLYIDMFNDKKMNFDRKNKIGVKLCYIVEKTGHANKNKTQ
jgi:hypothetical protein